MWAFSLWRLDIKPLVEAGVWWRALDRFELFSEFPAA
jgi:hypothetical protein